MQQEQTKKTNKKSQSILGWRLFWILSIYVCYIYPTHTLTIPLSTYIWVNHPNLPQLSHLWLNFCSQRLLAVINSTCVIHTPLWLINMIISFIRNNNLYVVRFGMQFIIVTTSHYTRGSHTFVDLPPVCNQRIYGPLWPLLY